MSFKKNFQEVIPRTVIFASVIFLLLSFTAFLNLLSSLYSNVDISRLDLSRNSRQKSKTKKIIYVIQNSYLLFISVSVLCAVLNLVTSRIVFNDIGLSNFINNSQSWVGWLVEFLVIFFLVFFTEILVYYLAERPLAKRWVLNSFLLNCAYYLIAWGIHPWSKNLIKGKKLSSYREKDLIQLVSNLEAEKTLEPQEARLLKAAFNFDEGIVGQHFRPRKKAILLSTKMTANEVWQVYYKYQYTRYPVVSEEKKIVGILNFKNLILSQAKREKNSWLSLIKKEVNYFQPQTKLNMALEACQRTGQKLALVANQQQKFIGIISRENILESLVGEMEEKKNFFPNN